MLASIVRMLNASCDQSVLKGIRQYHGRLTHLVGTTCDQEPLQAVLVPKGTK